MSLDAEMININNLYNAVTNFLTARAAAALLLEQDLSQHVQGMEENNAIFRLLSAEITGRLVLLRRSGRHDPSTKLIDWLSPRSQNAQQRPRQEV